MLAVVGVIGGAGGGYVEGGVLVAIAFGFLGSLGGGAVGLISEAIWGELLGLFGAGGVFGGAIGGVIIALLYMLLMVAATNLNKGNGPRI